ncbi:hypothetical protein THTE_0613 [Thermogutta terrifontis]|uniref:Uncharacterized protein n=1 Tax=Thermogutta terrifontis TaxID=1331910 RepID=A0A286RB83_9BACT|nr:hypothetical protein THTE_0613 [Thermogutta terrifontis]
MHRQTMQRQTAVQKAELCRRRHGKRVFGKWQNSAALPGSDT